MNSLEDELRYDNIPMFDHKGWPMHVYEGERTMYGCSGIPNFNISLHELMDGKETACNVVM